MTKSDVGLEDAGRIAGRVLIAWISGHSADVESSSLHGRLCRPEAGDFDSFELERFEALESALEHLRDPSHACVRAAVRVLEHLASQPPRPIKR